MKVEELIKKFEVPDQIQYPEPGTVVLIGTQSFGKSSWVNHITRNCPIPPPQFIGIDIGESGRDFSVEQTIRYGRVVKTVFIQR